MECRSTELIMEVRYENDLAVGTAKVWFGKNKLKEVVQFENGKRQ